MRFFADLIRGTEDSGLKSIVGCRAATREAVAVGHSASGVRRLFNFKQGNEFT
jgi:hypothetical protein